ncbi:hypothetical protein [Rhizobium leguminosarum]|uniref:hypothetical protein n=1 Tax=Rhizobium leguminosarum TaxID=384 RepID=UPI001440EC67|nr:hypothetical protein [Rhizobium leguminosarum]MBY5755877.1 hypothetical protein [Rhizobium leguminosarum]NKL86986.1 hypothetical protein [Rhizobium leguminosarum bv. viciae]
MYQLKSHTFELKNRISIVNARIDAEIDVPPHVAFDVAVDGKTIGSSLEWLDLDHDVVRNDCHLDINRDVLETVANRLHEDYCDVYAVVLQLLEDAVKDLKEAEEDIAGKMAPQPT